MTRPVNTILAISIIVFLAAVIGGVIWWQFSQQAEEISPASEQTSQQQEIQQNNQQQPELAGWKTYANEEYGFSFKYPNDWLAFEYGSSVFIGDTTKKSQEGNYDCKTKEEILSNYYLCPQIAFGSKYIKASSFEELLNRPEYKNATDIVGNPLIITKLGKIEKFDVVRIPPNFLLYDASAQRAVELSDNFFDINSNFMRQVLSTLKFTDVVSTADWKTYTSKEYNFEIKYPNDWIIREYDSKTSKKISMHGIGFGTVESIPGGLIWGVNIYDKTGNSASEIDDLIKEIGGQFADRQEKRAQVVIKGEEATKVSVTTPSVKDWYAETIIFEGSNKIYSIGNGAVKDNRFEDFYQSFSSL